MEKITELLNVKVVSEDGEYLGHLVDVRSDGDPEHGVVHKNRPITEILYCKRSALSFLAWRSPKVEIAAIDAVKKFTRKKIIVSAKKLG